MLSGNSDSSLSVLYIIGLFSRILHLYHKKFLFYSHLNVFNLLYWVEKLVIFRPPCHVNSNLWDTTLVVGYRPVNAQLCSKRKGCF